MPASLPLFPLNAALVPGLVLPLHIFEPRYRRMIEELLARPEDSDREFDEPECDLAPALVAQVRRLFSQYRALLGQQMFGEEILNPAAPDDQADLAYLVTASMVLPVAERQRLLAALDSRARLIEARNLLVRETGLITMLSCLPALDVASPGFCPN